MEPTPFITSPPTESGEEASAPVNMQNANPEKSDMTKPSTPCPPYSNPIPNYPSPESTPYPPAYYAGFPQPAFPQQPQYGNYPQAQYINVYSTNGGWMPQGGRAGGAVIITPGAGPVPIRESFGCHIALACVVFWCCGCVCGLVAFILALIASSSSSEGHSRDARRLGFASMGVSIAGIIIGIALWGVIIWAAVNSSTRTDNRCPVYTCNGQCFTQKATTYNYYGASSDCTSRYGSLSCYRNGYCYYDDGGIGGYM